jgi:hypothetical protein
MTILIGFPGQHAADASPRFKEKADFSMVQGLAFTRNVDSQIDPVADQEGLRHRGALHGLEWRG